MQRVRLVAVTVLVGVGGLLGTAGPVHASCAGTASVTASSTAGEPVFVGTVVSTTNHDHWATFAVEEVWSGDVADTQVVIAGMPPQGGGRFSGSEDDRTYELGHRYLVGARTQSNSYELKPGELADGECSVTTEWTDDLASQRPAEARLIERSGPIQVQASAMTDPDKGGSNTGLLIAVAAIVAIAGLALWLMLRRGSISHRADIDIPLPDEPADDLANPDPDSTP